MLAGLGIEAEWVLARNLALHAGVGLGVASLTDDGDPDAGRRGTVGAGYSVGVSYDWFPWRKRLTGGFAVTPVLQARVTPGDSATALVGLAGIELGYWTGLPRNQLELPDAEAYRPR